jgi:hypothetical protein
LVRVDRGPWGFGTVGALAYLKRREDRLVVAYSWLLGLAALAPAWLACILAILGQLPLEVIDTPLPRSVLFSSATALLGVIFTDFFNRRLQARDIAPRWMTLWLLGVAAFIPPWIIALWALS